MDFAIKKGVSLSTLRRYIKADKIQYRVESGRYLILDTEAADSTLQEFSAPTMKAAPSENSDVHRLEHKLKVVSAELQRAQKEIAELQTLIAFYEHSGSPSN
jgi:hypothetical protein